MINQMLDLIKEQTGLKLKLCDFFTGKNQLDGRQYFNVILKKRTSESEEYIKLLAFSKKYKTIKVEPNGLNRVAIFF